MYTDLRTVSDVDEVQDCIKDSDFTFADILKGILEGPVKCSQNSVPDTKEAVSGGVHIERKRVS